MPRVAPQAVAAHLAAMRRVGGEALQLPVRNAFARDGDQPDLDTRDHGRRMRRLHRISGHEERDGEQHRYDRLQLEEPEHPACGRRASALAKCAIAQVFVLAVIAFPQMRAEPPSPNRAARRDQRAIDRRDGAACGDDAERSRPTGSTMPVLCVRSCHSHTAANASTRPAKTMASVMTKDMRAVP